jgi:hypothetical protein
MEGKVIHHISIDAKNPQRVATVLAEILGGQSIPAPPVFPKGSRFVVAGDEFGSMIEVVPCGTEMRPGESEVTLYQKPTDATYIPNHAYVSVNLSVEELLRIGAREGWLTRQCSRGMFELVEFWIENRQMLELATPEMKAKYVAFMTSPEARQAALAEHQ